MPGKLKEFWDFAFKGELPTEEVPHPEIYVVDVESVTKITDRSSSAEKNSVSDLAEEPPKPTRRRQPSVNTNNDAKIKGDLIKQVNTFLGIAFLALIATLIVQSFLKDEITSGMTGLISICTAILGYFGGMMTGFFGAKK